MTAKASTKSAARKRSGNSSTSSATKARVIDRDKIKKSGTSWASSVIWEYPTWLLELLPKIDPEVRASRERELAQQHKETLARIDERVSRSKAAKEEAANALAWCRANGNPHLGGRCEADRNEEESN